MGISGYMKLFGCVTAMTVVFSCMKEERVTDTPISLKVISMPVTKGYVEGTTMYETPAISLHSTYPTKNLRTINLTSWYYPKSGIPFEYFRDERFDKDEDGLWHHFPALYWPLGGTLDFIGYSSSIPFPDGSVEYNRKRSTDNVQLTFDSAYTQDDVLFSSASGKKAMDADGNVSLVFKHSQAWIQFKLHAKTSSYENIFRIHKIVLKDVYTTGVLEVSHPFGEPEAQWSFRFDWRNDTVVEDIHGTYGTLLTSTPSYLDMLLPEQPMKDIIMYYSYDGSDPVMQYSFSLPNAYWLMGRKYVYEISFSPEEIRIIPTVQDWNGTSSSIPVL